MDGTRFDDLSRRLAAATTRRGGLKAALGALLGGSGLAASDAAAKRGRHRRKRCDPACAAGQTCVKGACRCDGGGTVCGSGCCLDGQRCEGERCVDLPEPGACIAFGEPCKNVGRPCCAGLSCASGQGGTNDVACYVHKTGPCTSTAECVYGTRCEEGICRGIPQPPDCIPDGASGCSSDADCCNGDLRCIDGACSTPECGTVPVTGDPAVDGVALKAALDAAAGQAGTVIQLAAGAYLLPQGTSHSVEWTSGDVAIEACPGASVGISGLDVVMFQVSGGSVTLKNLTLDNANGGQAMYGLAASGSGASARLENRVVTGMTTALSTAWGAVLTVAGGTYTGNTRYGGPDFSFLSRTVPSPGTLVCEGNPVAAGCCHGVVVPNPNCQAINQPSCNCSCTLGVDCPS